jgi:hypothetical protein
VPGLHHLAAGADLEAARGGALAEELGLVAVLRPASREDGAHAQLPVDVAGLQALARLKPLVERAQHLGRACARRLADHGEPVAAAQDLHAQAVLQGGKVAVMLAAEVDQEEVVWELQGGLALAGAADAFSAVTGRAVSPLTGAFRAPGSVGAWWSHGGAARNPAQASPGPLQRQRTRRRRGPAGSLPPT